jgi:hypothetical protein
MYLRSNSENCSRVDLGLEIKGKNVTFFRAVAPRRLVPLRLNLVGCAPAPLHSSRCTARCPGYLVASTRSGARRRRSTPPSVPLAAALDTSSPRPGQARACAALCSLTPWNLDLRRRCSCPSPPLSACRRPRARVASDLVRLGLSSPSPANPI